jgi:hypothetical protein
VFTARVIVVVGTTLLTAASCVDPLPAPAPAPAPAPPASPPTNDDVIDDFPTADVSLDRIKLVSTHPGAKATAIVEMPDGRRHTVRVGTMIGRSYGQVKEIRAGELVVQEETRDEQGKRHPYDVVMRP